MKYLSIRQTSEKWGISIRRIQVLCAENRIPGATKIGSYWAIRLMQKNPMMSVSRVENTLRKNKMQSVIKLFKCRWI